MSDADLLRAIASRIPYTMDVTTLYEIASRIDAIPATGPATEVLPRKFKRIPAYWRNMEPELSTIAEVHGSITVADVLAFLREADVLAFIRGHKRL